MRSTGLSSVVSAGLVLWCSACKTNTSGLELREPSAGGASTGGTGSSGLGGAASLGGAEADPDEPQPSEGPELSLVHGVVDGGQLVSCWLDPGTGAPVGGGAVEPGAGLEFGGVYRKAIDWDVSSEARQVELFSLPAAAVPSASCASLLSTPLVDPAPRDAGAGDAGLDAAVEDGIVRAFSEPARPRRAGSLLLAAGALGTGKSYALISAGCATRGELPPGSCGARDSISGEHLSLLLVEARYFAVEAALFGLQFVNASRSAGSLDIVLEPAQSSLPAIEIAREVALGSVRPRTTASVQVPARVQLGTSGSGAFQYRQDWQALLDVSGLDEIELGRSYLLVYLGPLLVPTGELVSGIAQPRLVLIAGPR
jgi:hypothetical protein